MSKFTGGYDLYDEIKNLGGGDINIGFNRFYGTKLYIQTEEKFQDSRLSWKQALQRSRKLIKYESLIDIAPYFQHLVQCQTLHGMYDTHENKGYVLITRKPAYKIGLNNSSINELVLLEKEFSIQLEKWKQGEIIE